jgi:hypothetical protein
MSVIKERDKEKILKKFEEISAEFFSEFDEDEFKHKERIKDLFNPNSPNKFKKISSNHFNNPAKPEGFYTNKYVKKVLTDIMGIDEKNLIDEARFTDTRDQHFYPDFQIDSKFKSKRGILIEVEEIGSDLKHMEKIHGLEQAKKWFKNTQALAKDYDAIITNFTDWYYLAYRKGKKNRYVEICEKKNLIEIYKIMKDSLEGVISDRDIITKDNTILDFYNDFKEIINKVINKKNKYKINCSKGIIKSEKIKFLRIVFFRLFFIKTLHSWGILKYNLIDNYVFNTPERADYYRNLKRVFFEVFNEEDHSKFSSSILKESPYLNGGLFRKQDIERKYDLSLNSYSLELIWDKLCKYRFSFKDEEENENVISIKALGHIFELTIDLTGGDRKGTGSYYTPDHIVDYINDNSITNYLLNDINKKIEKMWENNEKTNIECLIDSITIDKYQKASKKEIADLLFESLKNIRICDNACGSGAFLEASADKLIDIYHSLYSSLGYKWVKMNEEISNEFFSSLYEMRKHIITHNIFGIDIQQEAIEIARLRMWLWLVNPYDKHSDYIYSIENIEPLPNIEFNIIKGNSLIGYASLKDFSNALKQKKIGRLFSDVSQIEDIALKIKRYRLTTTKEKSELLRKEIKEQKDHFYKECNELYLNYKLNDLELELSPISQDFEDQIASAFEDYPITYLKIDLIDGYKNKEKIKSITKRYSGKNHNYRYSSRGKKVYSVYSMEKVSYERTIQILNDIEKENINEVILKRELIIDDLKNENVFHWVFEFFEPTQEGGFDIMIGNPPYFSTDPKYKRLSEAEFEILNIYETHNGQADILVYFYERAFSLLKEWGYLGFISKNRWQDSSTYDAFRDFLTGKHLFILDFNDELVFKKYKTIGVSTNIIFMDKDEKDKNQMTYCLLDEKTDNDLLSMDNYECITKKASLKNIKYPLENSITKQMFKKDDLTLKNGFGHKTTPSKIFKLERLEELKYSPSINSIEQKYPLIEITKDEKECIKPYISSGRIMKYRLKNPSYILYMREKDLEDYPNIQNYFMKIKLSQKNRWWEFHNGKGYRNTDIIESVPKIIYPSKMYLDRKNCFFFDDYGFVVGMDCGAIIYPSNTTKYLKYILLHLNSSLMWYYFRHKFKRYVKRQQIDIDNTPIPKSDNIDPYCILTDYLLFLNRSESEQQEKEKKDLIEWYYELSDYLIYESYFSNGMLETYLDSKLKSISYRQWSSLKWKHDLYPPLTEDQEKKIKNLESENINIISRSKEEINTRELNEIISSLRKRNNKGIKLDFLKNLK